MGISADVRRRLPFLATTSFRLAFLGRAFRSLGRLARVLLDELIRTGLGQPETAPSTMPAVDIAPAFRQEACPSPADPATANAAPVQMASSRALPTATDYPALPILPTLAPPLPHTSVFAVPFASLPGGHYELSVDVFFNARHFVVMGGRRGPIHTHSYRLQVRCTARSLDSNQCIVSFADVKRLTEGATAPFRQQLLNELPVFAGLQPTSECLVTVIAQVLEHDLRQLPIRLASVTLWETPSVSITYTPNGRHRANGLNGGPSHANRGRAV